METEYKPGEEVVYLDRNGSQRPAKVVSVDKSVIPYSYGIMLDGNYRETEYNRLAPKEAQGGPPTPELAQDQAVDDNSSVSQSQMEVPTEASDDFGEWAEAVAPPPLVAAPPEPKVLAPSLLQMPLPEDLFGAALEAEEDGGAGQGQITVADKPKQSPQEEIVGVPVEKPEEIEDGKTAHLRPSSVPAPLLEPSTLPPQEDGSFGWDGFTEAIHPDLHPSQSVSEGILPAVDPINPLPRPVTPAPVLSEDEMVPETSSRTVPVWDIPVPPPIVVDDESQAVHPEPVSVQNKDREQTLRPVTAHHLKPLAQPDDTQLLRQQQAMVREYAVAWSNWLEASFRILNDGVTQWRGYRSLQHPIDARTQQRWRQHLMAIARARYAAQLIELAARRARLLELVEDLRAAHAACEMAWLAENGAFSSAVREADPTHEQRVLQLLELAQEINVQNDEEAFLGPLEWREGLECHTLLPVRFFPEGSLVVSSAVRDQRPASVLLTNLWQHHVSPTLPYLD